MWREALSRCGCIGSFLSHTHSLCLTGGVRCRRVDEIRVRTPGRVVTLEGLVPNRTIRDMAEFDVWYVFGIDRMVNALQVQA